MHETGIGRKTVHFILEPMIRDNTDEAVQLGLAEHKGQNGNAEIVACDSKEERLMLTGPEQGGVHGSEMGDDAGGIVLQALIIKETRKFDFRFTEKNVSSRDLPKRTAQCGHDAAIRTPEWEKKDRVHGERFRPYFSIL